MLALRILATVFISISVLSSTLKDLALEEVLESKLVYLWALLSILWRAFVIVAIWVIK